MASEELEKVQRWTAKRRMPKKASRRISSVQRSPITSSVCASEQFMWSKDLSFTVPRVGQGLHHATIESRIAIQVA